MKSLQFIHNYITKIADVCFFTNTTESDATRYSNEEIARLVKGNRYYTTQEEIERLKVQKHNQLEELKRRIDNQKAELDRLSKSIPPFPYSQAWGYIPYHTSRVEEFKIPVEPISPNYDFLGKNSTSKIDLNAYRIDRNYIDLNNLSQYGRVIPNEKPPFFETNSYTDTIVDKVVQKIYDQQKAAESQKCAYDLAVQAKNQAEECYQVLLNDYNHTEAYFAQEILRKQSELEAALDEDILLFLNRLEEQIYDCSRNKDLFFEAFVLIYAFKKAFSFLSKRLKHSHSHFEANSIFDKMHNELQFILAHHNSAISQGFADAITYAYDNSHKNAQILEEIQKELEDLPHEVCCSHEEIVHLFLSLDTEINFSYQSIIAIPELELLTQKVQTRRAELQSQIIQLDYLRQELAPYFRLMNNIKASCQSHIRDMIANKEKFDLLFEDLCLVFGILDEHQQNQYLKHSQEELQKIRSNIVFQQGVDPHLLESIDHTKLWIQPALKFLKSDSAINFLEYEDKLNHKRQELENSVVNTDKILVDISHQPQNKVNECKSSVNSHLIISLLPIMNLIELPILRGVLRTFKLAFTSDHPTYVELRQSMRRRLSIFSQIHLGLLVILLAVLALNYDLQRKPLPYVLGATYLVSSAILARQSQLKFPEVSP